MMRKSTIEANKEARTGEALDPTEYEYLGSLIALQPHPAEWFVAQGRTVLRTERNGFIKEDSPHGLFVCETRLLSKYELRINKEAPIPVALSNVNQHSWIGYYVVLPPGIDPGPADKGSGDVQAYSENTLEIRITRSANDGIHEDIDLVNYSLQATSFQLHFWFDADFAYIEPSLKAFKWLKDYGDCNNDGFYDYKTRSKMGVRNQGWKDSSDAIVYPDGNRREVAPDSLDRFGSRTLHRFGNC